MRFGPFRLFEKKDATLANPDPAMLELFVVAAIGTISKPQALAVPAVNTAIRVISEAAATLAVGVVQKQDDGSDNALPDHPVAALLHSDVDDWTSGFDLIRDLVAMALTNDTGGLAWVNRVDGKPHEIILYRTGMIAVSYADTGEPTYQINEAKLQRADVIHLRSPFNQSPLTLALRAITVAWHMESHALNLFRKGARPGGVIQFPKMLGDEGLKKMRAGWRAAYEGSENGGGTAVLWDGATFAR